MSRLHRVTEEEVAAAELRLVTDKNLGRASPPVVVALARMIAGDVLSLPGAAAEAEPSRTEGSLHDFGGPEAGAAPARTHREQQASLGQLPEAERKKLDETARKRNESIREIREHLMAAGREIDRRSNQPGYDPQYLLLEKRERIDEILFWFQGSSGSDPGMLAELAGLIEELERIFGDEHPVTRTLFAEYQDFRDSPYYPRRPGREDTPGRGHEDAG